MIRTDHKIKVPREYVGQGRILILSDRDRWNVPWNPTVLQVVREAFDGMIPWVN